MQIDHTARYKCLSSRVMIHGQPPRFHRYTSESSYGRNTYSKRLEISLLWRLLVLLDGDGLGQKHGAKRPICPNARAGQCRATESMKCMMPVSESCLAQIVQTHSTLPDWPESTKDAQGEGIQFIQNVALQKKGFRTIVQLNTHRTHAHAITQPDAKA